MAVYLSATLRLQLEEADDHHCAYCRTSQFYSGHPMVAEHILPRIKGGTTSFANLCYSCYRCNLFKGSQTYRIDPQSGELTPLFHPRQHQWNQHFVFDPSGLQIVGLTAVGRATVIALNMNNDVIINARRNWARLGWSPLV